MDFRPKSGCRICVGGCAVFFRGSPRFGGGPPRSPLGRLGAPRGRFSRRRSPKLATSLGGSTCQKNVGACGGILFFFRRLRRALVFFCLFVLFGACGGLSIVKKRSYKLRFSNESHVPFGPPCQKMVDSSVPTVGIARKPRKYIRGPNNLRGLKYSVGGCRFF